MSPPANGNGRLPADTSFAIIGAGAAGLTAARALRERGYRNVSVLEAAPTAGGKCDSVLVDGRPYDLGCLAGSRHDYRDVLKLAASHGTGALDFGVRHYSLARGGEVPLFTAREQLRFVRELATAAWLRLGRWRGLRRGEMTGLSDELCDSFGEVVARHDLHLVERKVRGMIIACGFGAPRDMPAAYAANYASPRITLGPSALFTWRDGAQLMWQREAEALAGQDVAFRFGARVTDVCRPAFRNGDRGSVQLGLGDGSALTADELIVAADPTGLPLDASPEEGAVFAQVRHLDYRVLLCRIGGLPPARGPSMHFVAENLVADREGRPMALFRRHAASDVCAVYVYGAGLGDEMLAANVAEDVARLGWRLDEVIAVRGWTRYFPHFGGASLRAGALESLYALQGARHTTYVGELLNFAILPRIMDNARLTMERLVTRRLPGQQVSFSA